MRINRDAIVARTWQQLQALLPATFMQRLIGLLRQLGIPAADDTNTIDIVIDLYERTYRHDGICVYINGKPHVLRVPNYAVCRLPLGPVTASSCNYEALRALWREVPPHPDFERMYGWLHTPALADKLEQHLPVFLREQEHIAARLAKPHDSLEFMRRKNLTDMGVAVDAPQSDVPGHPLLKFWAHAFLVEKSDGATSRFIWNGGDFDDLFHAALGPQPKMPTLNMRDVVRRLLHGWKRISAADFKSFFFQFGLHPKLQKFFGFYMRGVPMVMIVLPMGVCFAPAWAQHAALYLVEVLRHRLPGMRFDIIVWIDNLILLCNTPEEERIIQQEADKLFAEVGLATKGWTNGTNDGTRIEALGLFIDLVDLIVRPTQAAIDELRESRSRFFKHRTPATFSQFTGKVIWFSYVGCIPLCRFGALMDVMRHQSRRVAHDASTWLHPDLESFGPAFQAICDTVRDIAVLAITQGRQDRSWPTATYYTDASTEYIAGIRQSDDAMFIVPIKGDHRTIQTAELLGGIIGAIIFQEPNAVWAVDNTVAKFAMLKGHSACHAADETLRFALDLVHVNIIALPSFVAWVPTECMRADALTRPDITPETTGQLHTCAKTCHTQLHTSKLVPRWSATQPAS